MKRILCAVLALLMLPALASCGGKQGSTFKQDGYKDMLDAAIKLPTEFSRELLEQVIPQGEIEYYINYYQEKGEDYLVVLEGDYKSVTDKYTEDYGSDWALSYTITEVIEKDEEGIEKYKKYDSHYFSVYGVDTDKIQAVTFVKVRVHLESSSYSNDKDKTIQCFCIDNKWYSFYGTMLGLKL